MSKMIMFFLGVSCGLAIQYIRKIARAEEDIISFPQGDIGEFIEVDYSYSLAMYVFFPSIILVKLYMGIVRIINSLL